MRRLPGIIVVLAVLAAAMRAASAAEFVPVSSLPEPFIRHSLIASNGRLYNIGGINDAGILAGDKVYYAKIEGPDALGPWTPGAPLPNPTFFHAAAAYEGVLYVLGGYSFNGGLSLSNRVYFSRTGADGAPGAWEQTLPMPEALYLHSVAVWNGTLYVSGGAGVSGLSSRVYAGRLAAGGGVEAWTEQTPLPVSVYTHAAVQDGTLYTLGGLINGGSEVHNGVYMASILPDGTIGPWAETTPLPEPLSTHAAAVAGGRVYVFGGWTGSGPTAAVRSAAIRSDKTLGPWEDEPPMPAALYQHAAAAAGGVLYISGGTGDGSTALSGVYAMNVAPEPAAATVDFSPDTLQLFSKGMFVKATVEFPPATAKASDILSATVRIVRVNGVDVSPLSPIPKFTKLGDEDEDGIEDLRLKFLRISLALRLPAGDNVVELEGSLADGRGLTGTGEITAKRRGRRLIKIAKLFKNLAARARFMREVKVSSRCAMGFVDSEGARVAASHGAAVDVPAGVGGGLVVSVSPDEGLAQEEYSRREGARSSGKLTKAGEAFRFGPHGAEFSRPVTIELPYDPANLPPGAKEERLQVHYWNTLTGRWEALITTVDKTKHVARAETDHFSTFQVFGGGVPAGGPGTSIPGLSFGEVYAYPNPARGRNPILHIEAPEADSVELRIYDLSGELKHAAEFFEPVPFIEHVWDVSGVGSGVYLYVLTAKRAGVGTIRTRGKAAVVK